MKPIYKKLTFKNKRMFEKWLNKTTYKQIVFEDNGQDLMKIWIAESGEIINCNQQSSIWNGKFVDLVMLEVGLNIDFWNLNRENWDTMDFIVSEIN